MNTEPRDDDDLEDTRSFGDDPGDTVHTGDTDDTGDPGDTVREVPAGQPSTHEETLEGRPGEDTIVQGEHGETEGGPTGSTRPTDSSGGPTRPTSAAGSTRESFSRGPSPTAQTEPKTREVREKAQKMPPGDQIQATKTQILGERAEVFAGRFEVLRTIGQGGMGRVYAVRDRQIDGRKMALKILLPKFSKNENFRKLFFDEIRANQKFVSEYVVQIRDTGQAADGYLFLTMDLVDGISLGQLIKREGGLQPRHGLEIARQVLLGLQPGHEKGIIHRDIKPSNVMLVSRTQKTEDNPFGVAVRLLDFGIAAIASELSPGQIIGTPQYMSPEQLEGERLDPRTDLFSVGVLLYEMISGKRPFGGTTLQEISRALRETQIPDLVRNLEGLPKPIQKVLSKALQKDRKKRYQSAEEFIAAIEGSSAFKPETKMPAWSSILLFLMTATVAGETYYITTQNARWAQNVSILNQNEAHLQTISGLNDDLRESRALTAKLQSDLDAMQSRDTAVQSDRGREYTDLTGKLVELETKFDIASRERDEARRKSEKLQKELDRLTNAGSEDAKRALCFDKLLERLQERLYHTVDPYLEEQRAIHVFSIANKNGTPYVRRLADAARAIDERDPAGARAALDALRSDTLLNALRADGEPWLRYVVDLTSDMEPEAAQAERMARLQRVLEQLESEVANVEASLADARLEAEQLLVSLPPDAEPATVLAQHEMHEDLVLEPFLERFADLAESRVVRGGQFDLSAANQLPQLATWSGWLDGDGADETGDGATRVRELAAARAWYDAGVLPPITMFPITGDLTSWRGVLALQVALSRGDSAWPPKPGAEAVYRMASDRRVTWVVEVGKVSGSDWGIDKTIWSWSSRGQSRPYDDEETITRKDSSYLDQDGRLIVDLRATNGSLRVEYWEPDLGPWPEELHPFAKRLSLDSFRDRIQSERVPCLVSQQAGVEYWLSPKYGLVQETGEAFSRVLVHLEGS